MITHTSHSPGGDGPQPTGFTRETQRKLTAMRVVAYSLASLFMIVMVVRGVWVTRDQMEAEADRSVRSAAAALALIQLSGSVDPGKVGVILRPLAPANVVLRTVKLADRPLSLVAVVDHAAIWRGALSANLGYIAFVLALGLPVIAIFLYMGWLVNRPALQLLVFAQGGQDGAEAPPQLPALWNPVLARLQQLRDSQSQMQAFLDHAPIGMMFRNAAGKLVMVNRYGASFYDETPEQLTTKPISFFNAYFPESERLAKPMFLDPLLQAEITSVETEFHGPSGEVLDLLISSFPVTNENGDVELVGNFFVDVTVQRRAEAELNESRAQLVGFFDNIPTSIYLKRADHTVVYVSKHLAEQYGKTPEEMVGQHEYDLHVDEMKPYLKMMDEHIMATGEAVLMEGEHLQFHRQELVSRFPVFNDKGEITHIGGMNFDIDARAKAQAELTQSRASLQAFFDNLPGLAFLSSLDGTIIAANSYMADHFGMKKMTPEFLVGKSGRALLPASWAGHSDQAINANNSEGKPYSFETTFDRPDGKRYVSATRFPIRNAEGEITHVGGLVFDRTQEKAAAEEIAASRESLHQSEKLAALGSLLAGVSHELNNPLAAVIGQTALLGEDLDGTEHADRVSKIKRAADRCARIVQSFLAMARQKAPEYKAVEINDQVRAAVELTEYQMRAATITIDLNLAEQLPAIKADSDALHQVIVNLLTNARQALEEKDGERRIVIATSLKKGAIRLSVADNGKGIDPATRERIFDPFFTTKAVGSGTGIGLSYSLGIIESHGGSITIEGADVGTVFVITLPIVEGATDVAGPEIGKPATAKGRALVIDDEEDVAETLADMLQRMGMEVTVALGGVAGQSALSDRASFDLILSDVRMPDCDGPALHAWMATHRPKLINRLAFVTGDTLSGIAADFLETSGCPVLEKPFTPAGLRELVRVMLER